jgi:hypothetical protein
MLTMRRLAVFALLAGCADRIDFGEFPQAEIDARCGYFERCGVIADYAECRAYYDMLAIDDPSPQAAYDAGNLTYDEAAARQCIDNYTLAPCDATQLPASAFDVCREAIQGTLDAGAACGFSTECRSDNCVKPSCPEACCTGQCGPPIARPAVNQPCTGLCVEGAYCGIDSICHTLLADGAACADEVCDFGLYCRGNTSTTAGTCAPLPHLGEACEDACAEVGATCYAGTCVALGLLGDPCEAQTQCSRFYECRNSQCSLLPTLGNACTTTCYEAAYCDGTSCVEQKANGATCLYNDECQTHFCDRDAATGTCADVALCI